MAEFEANKEQRISEMAEHRQELEEQHEFVLLDIEQEMAHAEQAIEEARQDIEKSYRNGDIPELQLREMKRSLDRAKQDVQRSRASFDTRVFIAPTPPVVPALISQLSVVTELALPVAAPLTAGSSDASEQPDYRIYDPRVSQ